jgi:hypothetical protein
VPADDEAGEAGPLPHAVKAPSTIASGTAPLNIDVVRMVPPRIPQRYLSLAGFK